MNNSITYEEKKKNIEYQKQYRLKNKEKLRDKRKKYEIINKDRIQECQKKYRLENKEKLVRSNREYNLRNKEKRNKQSKEYYHNHIQEAKIYNKQHHLENKERDNKRSREWAQNIKLEVMLKYGGNCVACGETDLATLSIDHINNDGYEKRKNGEDNAVNAGYMFYLELRDNPKRNDLQCLCMNCQFKKRAYGPDFTQWQNKAKHTKQKPHDYF